MRSAFVGSCLVMLFVIAGCSRSTSSGRELYSTHCANCHGRYADGEGPAAVDAPVPDLRYIAARNGGEFPRAWVTEVIDGREIIEPHGDRHMPIWGDVFAEQESVNGSGKARAAANVQALVDYLVQVQQKQ
jgi:mono/diheme cytochrome c family protein